jgi:hypothetical protein
MKHNKYIIPMFISAIILTSCGLGDLVTKETFLSKIGSLANSSYTKVEVFGSLTTRYVEFETKIDIKYNFTLTENSFVPEVVDDVSTFLLTTLTCSVNEDYESSLIDQSAEYYIKGDSGFSITYSIGSVDEKVSKESANYRYEYNQCGLYTAVYEKETYIENGLTYTSLLDIKFNWKL